MILVMLLAMFKDPTATPVGRFADTWFNDVHACNHFLT